MRYEVPDYCSTSALVQSGPGNLDSGFHPPNFTAPLCQPGIRGPRRVQHREDH